MITDRLVDGRCGPKFSFSSFNSNWVACLRQDEDGNCPHGFPKLDSSYTYANEQLNLCGHKELCCLLHPEFDLKDK